MNASTEAPARPGRTVLRVPAVRWLTAELIPFCCLAAGFAVARELRPAGASGLVLTLIGTPVLTVFYLYKVLGAAVGWVLPLIPLSVLSTGAGAVTLAGTAISQSPGDPGGTKIVATNDWWIATACLALALAVTVALAVMNGEHWVRRNGRNLPRNKFEAYARSRGTLARLWLSRQPGAGRA